MRMLSPPAEFSHVPCRVFMDKIPPVANASDKLLDTTRRLLDINYDSVLVYDANVAIGLVTIKDIVKYLIETKSEHNLAIGDLVTVPLITVKSETSLQEAFSTMNKFKINYVVIEEDDIIKGIVSSSTIQEFCENNSHYLREYT
jgi:signal-transduction protein with cAMP-binding, CBS, and nucleotidyltransferase domain